jgi:hypothetical protein
MHACMRLMSLTWISFHPRFRPPSPGGIIEASIKLPGKSDTGGLWPAFWLMGNLGRATYEVRPCRVCVCVLLCVCT